MELKKKVDHVVMQVQCGHSTVWNFHGTVDGPTKRLEVCGTFSVGD